MQNNLRKLGDCPISPSSLTKSENENNQIKKSKQLQLQYCHSNHKSKNILANVKAIKTYAPVKGPHVAAGNANSADKKWGITQMQNWIYSSVYYYFMHKFKGVKTIKQLRCIAKKWHNLIASTILYVIWGNMGFLYDYLAVKIS